MFIKHMSLIKIFTVESDRSKQKGKKRNEPSPFSQQIMKGAHQFNQPFSGLNLNAETDDYESKVKITFH